MLLFKWSNVIYGYCSYGTVLFELLQNRIELKTKFRYIGMTFMHLIHFICFISIMIWFCAFNSDVRKKHEQLNCVKWFNIWANTHSINFNVKRDCEMRHTIVNMKITCVLNITKIAFVKVTFICWHVDEIHVILCHIVFHFRDASNIFTVLSRYMTCIYLIFTCYFFADVHFSPVFSSIRCHLML